MPQLDQAPPIVTVADLSSGQFGRGPGRVTVNDRRILVQRASRVPDHGGGVDPLKTVFFQVHGTNRRGGHRHRIERAVQVTDVAGKQFGTAHRATGVGLGFQHQYIPAGVGQHRGRHQPVVPCTDDDGVDVAAGREPSAARRRHRGSPRSAPTARCIRCCAAPPRRAARCWGSTAVGATPPPRSSPPDSRRGCRKVSW